MTEKVVEKFLRYVSIDTRSDGNSDTHPSSAKQKNLLTLLTQELQAMGVPQVEMTECNVMAHIPSNISQAAPAIGFIAHVDTSPDMSGENVHPQIINYYSGGDIVLDAAKNIVLRVSEFPELKKYTGQTLITTDGSTLLGADDKAGVATIMSLAEHLMLHPEIQHGKICIAFTTDEEIGQGVDFFDVAKFGATYAYTVDGGEIGELEYENFNAAVAKIFVQGKNIHPGYAKNKMLNASLVGLEFGALLPHKERPECTRNYEGFFHLAGFSGKEENAQMQYLIRDHDRKKFEQRKQFLLRCAEKINKKHGANTLKIEISDQYYNMRSQIEPHYHIVQTAMTAMQQAGVTPLVRPIRGGTDGARLSYMGLPCPNLFTGGHNFHGKYEFIPIPSLKKSVEVLFNILRLFAESA